MKNIFISSTFRDMQAERDLVQERVLPALREEARKYGDNVGVIDLRWGVDTSTLETEEGAAKVLKVCLDEIDRSHPYMLIFIGERYGWIPEGKLIEKAISGREDKYVTDDYAKSVTALEIEYGALSEKYGELNHCVVCFREPVVHMLDGAEKALYVEHTEEGKRKLEALKERIKRDLGDDDRLITYSCTWDKSARQLVDFTSNGQPLETVLTNCFVEMFRDDWKEYEKLSWQDKEQLAFRTLMESKLRSFVGREELLEEYYQKVLYREEPFILRGEEGSGKTAAMCKLAERLQNEGRNVFTFFAREGSKSNSGESLIKQMVYYMEKLLGVEEHIGEGSSEDVEYGDCMKRLEELCYQMPKGEPPFFFIDGVDLLEQNFGMSGLMFVERLRDIWEPGWDYDEYDAHSRGYNWDEYDAHSGGYNWDEYEEGDWEDDGEDDWEDEWDDENTEEESEEKSPLIEKRIGIIISCGLDYETNMGCSVIDEKLPLLKKEERKNVLKGIVSSFSREMYDALEMEIVSKKGCCNPLYIWLLVQRLNMMDSEELSKAMSEEDIIEVAKGIIRGIPDTFDGALLSIFQSGISKFCEDEREMWDVLNYLAVSRNGLQMRDLQGVFQNSGRKFNMLSFVGVIKYFSSFFVIGEDSRINYANKKVRRVLLKSISEKERYEADIRDYVMSLSREDIFFLQEGMYYARITEDIELANILFAIAGNSDIEDENPMLREAIYREACKDDGEFYRKAIVSNGDEKAPVREYFLRIDASSWADWVQKMLAEALVQKCEEIHERYKSEESLKQLSESYYIMGVKQDEKRVMFLKKSINHALELHDMQKSKQSRELLGKCYFQMSSFLTSGISRKKRLEYYEKMLDCGVYRRKKRVETVEPNVLAMAYMRFAKERHRGCEETWAREQESRCYEKALLCVERVEDENRKNEICIIISEQAGRCFLEHGWVNKALDVFYRSTQCVEQQLEKDNVEKNEEVLSDHYTGIGRVLYDLGRYEEAVAYFKAVCERSNSIMNARIYVKVLKGVSVCLLQGGERAEAEQYFLIAKDKARKLYERSGTERDRDLLDELLCY